MNKIVSFLVVILLLNTAAIIFADSKTRPATEQEKEYLASIVVPAMAVVKKAMPQAPEGWVITSETKIGNSPPKGSGDIDRLHFEYTIVYKRIAGVKEEKKRLDDAYFESSRKHEETARPRIEELIDLQNETARALRKATRRKNHSEMQRLNDELDENGRKMKAIHEEVDTNIARDVEPYLVKDAEASISVALNDSEAAFPRGEMVTCAGAAFALRREGERVGVTMWREGTTMLLYGDWQLVNQDTFHANGEQPLFAPQARTIRISIVADKKRADELLKQMGLKALMKLMKEPNALTIVPAPGNSAPSN